MKALLRIILIMVFLLSISPLAVAAEKVVQLDVPGCMD